MARRTVPRTAHHPIRTMTAKTVRKRHKRKMRYRKRCHKLNVKREMKLR